MSVDSGATAAYVYDAEGKRVRKTTGGLSVDYVYDLAGAAMTEMSATGGWNRGEVYAGGRHVATYASSTTYFRWGLAGNGAGEDDGGGSEVRDGDESGVWGWAGGDGELRGSEPAAFYGEAAGCGERVG